MERAGGLGAHGPIMAGFYVLFLAILIIFFIIIVPGALAYYFMPSDPKKPRTAQIINEQPKEVIDEDDFDGW
jgi:Na+-transporting methylmalonyl-CoA/oxaloacetate decarboxylase gamma subunit